MEPKNGQEAKAKLETDFNMDIALIWKQAGGFEASLSGKNHKGGAKQVLLFDEKTNTYEEAKGQGATAEETAFSLFNTLAHPPAGKKVVFKYDDSLQRVVNYNHNTFEVI